MALPRVFVSSTCYDLAQIRDSLSEFIFGYFYEPMLSERGDVFYHPDLHTHESCVNEIENCQLFILIIGGRFGGSYTLNPTKSITNAEYEAAKFRKIPVFTFIKRDLYEDHRLYQRNKHNKEIIKKIVFPSIENQEYAANIFEFINQVRLAEVNNGFQPFEFVRDIKQYLGKQWAGMMFEFLNERSRENNQKIVRNTLDNLTLLNKKTEELIEGLVRKLNPEEGNQQIQSLDEVVLASKFFQHISQMYQIKSSEYDIFNKIIINEPEKLTWYEYLATDDSFTLKDNDIIDDDEYKTTLLLSRESVRVSWSVVTVDNVYPDKVDIAKQLYEHVRKLNLQDRVRAVRFLSHPIDS